MEERLKRQSVVEKLSLQPNISHRYVSVTEIILKKLFVQGIGWHSYLQLCKIFAGELCISHYSLRNILIYALEPP